jgi:phosphatidylserine/phosphatidylglycerophosphate/cardiolipin synthase-like enzyme
MTRKIALRLSAIFLLAACAGNETGSDTQDDTALPYAEGSQEALAIVHVANDSNLGVVEFDDEVGLHSTAARNLVAHRDGDDPDSAEDDDRYDNLRELFGVSYCKTSCVNRILKYAKDTGVYDQYGSGGDGVDVIFSPQEMSASHLSRAATLIDQAEDSIDIAMYSYSNADPVKSALKRAVERGVHVRFLANSALANSDSKGGALEDMGIDVRRVTKIMHHKLAIIDGPRDNDSLGNADSANIVTGSANWSTSAATQYDENTLFMQGGYPELALRLQRDFDTLWAGSKDVVYESYVWDQTRADITDDLIAQNESEDVHAYFTSFNFRSNGNGGWSLLESREVTDKLVDAILDADDSLEIATGHFLSIPIAQAVVDAQDANPNLTVDIVLDCQETSKSGAIRTLKQDIVNNGGSIVYKCNTYRWHYKFAKQMHHKYLITDKDTLYTGSLNFSENAETNTFENMLMFRGSAHASLVEKYRDNHLKVSTYGTEDDNAALAALRDDIENGSSVPLTWSPAITMDLDTFLDLKDLIRAECPATQTWTDSGEARTYNKWFNSKAQWFKRCEKNGYAWPDVPEEMRQ